MWARYRGGACGSGSGILMIQLPFTCHAHDTPGRCEMPAVTVDDLTVLDRLATPGLGDTVRGVKQLIDAPKGYEGEGFPVRRAFAGVDLRDLDPFVHMDQMGE